MPIQAAIALTLSGRLLHGTVEDKIVTSATRYEQSASKDAFTPAITLAWRPNTADSIYARVSTGFRQGGLARAGSGVSRSDGDELRSMELGWRHRSTGLVLEANLHRARWNDIQADMLIAGGITSARNIGDATLTGLDLRGEVSLPHGVSLRSGIFLLATRLNTARLPDAEIGLAFAAPFRGNAELSKQFDVAGWRVTVQSDATFTARRNFFPTTLGGAKLPNAFDVGASLRLHHNLLSFLLRGSNLLDSRRQDFAFGSPVASGSDVQLSSPRPRYVEANVGLAF